MQSMKNTHIQIPCFQKARVLVYGDVMLDRYWVGDSHRISPEAPVPVVAVKKVESRPGGAANVALNIAALQGHVELFGLVGDDSEASLLTQLLAEKKVTSHLLRLPNTTTTVKLRVLGQNQQLLRLDFEKPQNDFNGEALIQTFEKQLANAHVLVLSDYAKGALNNVQRLIELANENGVPTLIDPKANDFSRYHGATLLTPNAKEFSQAVGECRDQKDMVKKAIEQIEKHHLQALLITLGKDGMLLVEQSGHVLKLEAMVREVYDVTGAGDTVIAVMAAAMAAGSSMADAAELANVAAGLVVRKLGAATITESELYAELHQDGDSEIALVVKEVELLSLVQAAKIRGEKVVFTNGCFDLLHAGHVQYLAKAKALGDRLIVAVNTDKSVKKLKGSARPLNSLAARMEVVASLRAVDWVVPFSEETPERLINALLPDILVKGADYKVEQIAGHKAVLANGGEVKTIALKRGYSTTNLLEKIKGSE